MRRKNPAPWMGRAAKRKGSEEMRLGAALDGKGKGKGKWERPGMGNSAGAPNAWAKRARQSHRPSPRFVGRGAR